MSQAIIVDLPRPTLSQMDPSGSGRRLAYLEASRDGVVDRENEMVAVQALWDSRELMLEQGDFDISHWSHLANEKTGRPQPEYRIGAPTDIKRSGLGIFVKGDIYSNLTPPPENSSGDWADRWWHSVHGQVPAAKWFPSVYGTITDVDYKIIKGQQVRRIVKCDWYSMGFALRAQHPDLPAVSLSPFGPLAKADTSSAVSRIERAGGIHLSWGQFAKAVSTVGAPVTDHASLTGLQALAGESLEGGVRRGSSSPAIPALHARAAVLRKIKSGDLAPTLKALTRAFAVLGHPVSEAKKLLEDLARLH